MADDPGVLTSQQLADRYGVSIRTVEDWRLKETGPEYFPAGRHVCYHLTDVVEWELKRKAERAAMRKSA